MTDDESFEELMKQGSLGSPGARRLRERTSEDKARLVLRMIELRERLEWSPSEVMRMENVRLSDELDGVVEELQTTRVGTAALYVRTAHKLARRRGNLEQALRYLAKARSLLEEAEDWEGSLQVLLAGCALSIREGRPSRALQTLHEMSQLLASHSESGARLGTVAQHLAEAVQHAQRETTSAAQEASSESTS